MCRTEAPHPPPPPLLCQITKLLQPGHGGAEGGAGERTRLKRVPLHWKVPPHGISPRNRVCRWDELRSGHSGLGRIRQLGSLCKQRDSDTEAQTCTQDRSPCDNVFETGGLRLQAKECWGPPEVTRTHEAVKQPDPVDALISKFQPPEL